MAIKTIKTDIELVGSGARTRDNVQAINDNFTELAAASGASQGVAVANATDSDDVVDQLNALLASLRTAGFIAT